MRPHTLARFFALALALCAFPFVGCDSNDDPDEMTVVDPSDPNAISDAITFSTSAQQVQGNAPQPTTDADSPTLTGTTSSQVTPGAATSVSLNVDGSANVAGFYFQVSGAGSYFDVDYVGTPLTTGSTAFSFTLPEDLAEGSFGGLICVYDDNGLISNPVEVSFNVSFGIGQGDGNVRVSGAVDDSYDGIAVAFVTTSDDVSTLILGVADADPLAGSEDRIAIVGLFNVTETGTYSIGFPSLTGFGAYEDSNRDITLDIATSGSVTLTTFSDDRVAGSFDYSGPAVDADGEEIGELRVRGSFTADVEAGDAPFGTLRIPEEVFSTQ